MVAFLIVDSSGFVAGLQLVRCLHILEDVAFPCRGSPSPRGMGRRAGASTAARDYYSWQFLPRVRAILVNGVSAAIRASAEVSAARTAGPPAAVAAQSKPSRLGLSSHEPPRIRAKTPSPRSRVPSFPCSILPRIAELPRWKRRFQRTEIRQASAHSLPNPKWLTGAERKPDAPQPKTRVHRPRATLALWPVYHVQSGLRAPNASPTHLDSPQPKTRVQRLRATLALWPVSDRATVSTAGLPKPSALGAVGTLMIVRQ